MDDILTREDLQRLASVRQQPCASIYLPTHRAGPETQQDQIRLKNLLRQAEEALVKMGMRRTDAAATLQPAKDLLTASWFWRHQSDGLAIFATERAFHFFRLPLDFEELVVVTHRFHLTPLLPLFVGDGRFFVLAVSQKSIRLLQGTRHSLDQIELTTVPTSLADALQYDLQEKQLQFHTRTPGGVGRRAAIFHGHGVGTDDAKDRLLRYFHQIDEGLGDILRGERSPLLLAAVAYLMPIYRQANSYAHLLAEGITGNPDELMPEELHAQAWAVVEPQLRQAEEAAKSQYKELLGTGRASYQVQEIIPAAFGGRVDTLFVTVGTQLWGSVDPASHAVEVHTEAEVGDEDLLDLAAIQTIGNGGTVFALGSADMPEGGPMAAIFRY